MCGRGTPSELGGPVVTGRAALGGGAPQSKLWQTNCTLRLPEGRDSVASDTGDSSDRPLPPGWLAHTCNLASSVELLRCQRLRSPRQPVLFAGPERSCRLCVLMNPLSCRVAIHMDLPAKCLKNLLLRAGLFRGGARGNAAGPLQFTNLRMRTFIAAPSARKVKSTEEPP